MSDSLAVRLDQVCRLKGSFRLRSGATATEYFDKYQFEADPSILREVAIRLAGLIPGDTEILAGLELGGVPVATALSLETGLPLVLVRKVAKDYGTAKLIEGPEIADRRLLVVEDVVTSGGQILASTDELRRSGGLSKSRRVCRRSRGGRCGTILRGLRFS